MINTNAFKIGTFNLYNLVLPNTPYHNRQIYTPEEYQKKMQWVSSQLVRMGADIVGFQEVFHAAALTEALKLSQLYEQGELILANPTGQNPVVGLVSNFPIISWEVFSQFPVSARLEVDGMELPFNRFSHPILAAKIAIKNNLICRIFVVHLKSKRPIFPDGVNFNSPLERAKGQALSLLLRAAEATAFRHILLEILKDKDEPVIVMGDINDGSLAVTSQIITGDIPRKNQRFEKKQDLWDILLYVAKDIQERQSFSDHYYTHIHNGHYESLDHIMVSQEWVAQNPANIGRVTYVSVFNDHLLDDTLAEETIPNWQSDHGQVVVSLNVNS
jgi:predicted extracellular nuclease